ncbi:MAG TPA: MBL fold metallo-hydrolase [Erysipelotrichaceae bacterium]|nr:MBL fold metallo-hydrolase [Erysipelotrichaceae bacterium]
MTLGIKTINLGGVNCYLVKAGDSYLLIDTGFSSKRAYLEKELESAGVMPGNLTLIILTHGDSDHADNSAYLREKYGAKITMHLGDSGMVENGDMSWNRKFKPDKISITFRISTMIFSGLNKPGNFNTFKPDFYIGDGQNLSEYGFCAEVLHLPGHSKGSIGILATGGELFCGDLFYNFAGFNYIDDLTDFNASINKLKNLKIETIYPGHGKPFSMSSFKWPSP